MNLQQSRVLRLSPSTLGSSPPPYGPVDQQTVAVIQNLSPQPIQTYAPPEPVDAYQGFSESNRLLPSTTPIDRSSAINTLSFSDPVCDSAYFNSEPLHLASLPTFDRSHEPFSSVSPSNLSLASQSQSSDTGLVVSANLNVEKESSGTLSPGDRASSNLSVGTLDNVFIMGPPIPSTYMARCGNPFSNTLDEGLQRRMEEESSGTIDPSLTWSQSIPHPSNKETLLHVDWSGNRNISDEVPHSTFSPFHPHTFTSADGAAAAGRERRRRWSGNLGGTTGSTTAPGQPPRAPNAWLLYRSDKMKHVAPSLPGQPRLPWNDSSVQANETAAPGTYDKSPLDNLLLYYQAHLSSSSNNCWSPPSINHMQVIPRKEPGTPDIDEYISGSPLEPMNDGTPDTDQVQQDGHHFLDKVPTTSAVIEEDKLTPEPQHSPNTVAEVTKLLLEIIASSSILRKTGVEPPADSIGAQYGPGAGLEELIASVFSTSNLGMVTGLSYDGLPTLYDTSTNSTPYTDSYTPSNSPGDTSSPSGSEVRVDTPFQTPYTLPQDINLDDSPPDRTPIASKQHAFHPYSLATSRNAGKPKAGRVRKEAKSSEGIDSFCEIAFTDASTHPDPFRRRLLTAVILSQFYIHHRLEPIIGSLEANELLGNIQAGSGDSVIGMDRAGKSIYLLFIDTTLNLCLICGKAKDSLDRTLGCIRSHLNHRPFWCSGATVGCKSCTNINDTLKFYTRSHLDDHLARQSKRPTCVACGRTFCRGNIARHWRATHSDIPFPSNIYPRYKKGSQRQSLDDLASPAYTSTPSSD